MKEDRVSYLTVARRFIPWLLVNYLLLPLSYALIYVGWGHEVATEFRNEVML